MALRSNAVAALLILCGCAILVGCSNKDRLYKISGTVAVAGEPIPQGTITFTPVDGVGRDCGAKIIDGKFEAQVTRGEKRVKCIGAKIIGQIAHDPLYPDRLTNEYQDYPEEDFKEEIVVEIQKNKQVVDVNFTAEGIDLNAPPEHEHEHGHGHSH